MQTFQTHASELSTGTLFAGRFEVIEELGHGGMGRVYKVFDRKVKEKLALKVLNPEVGSDPRIIERFGNELKFARRITHPHVCRMHDLNETQGTHFITMEYVSGEDLKNMIRMVGQLSPGQAVTVARQVCAGLAEAHRLGIVHRDLKPQNIMINREGSAKIMDFGIARSLKGKGITDAGVIIGTPEYMAPEQVEGKETDGRTDIYALGVILFEMVTGRLPFEGETPLSVAVKQKTEPPPAPSTLNPRVPADLSGIILTCLEKEKSRRFQTVAELDDELRKLETAMPASEPVLPRRKATTSKQITFTFGLRRLLVPVLVGLALIGIALVIFLFIVPKKTAPVQSGRPSLAVMYFENRSGMQDLDRVLVDMLTTNIGRYEGIDIVSSQRLFDILRQLGKHELTVIDKGVATEVARTAGVRTMLLGSIARLGEKILITSHLTDVGSGMVMASEQVQGAKPDDLFRMADDLTLKLGEKLGLVKANMGRELKIADVTTDSLEAYRFYQKGTEQVWRFDMTGAAEWSEKAVAQDPTFASAYLLLASSKSFFGFSFNNPFSDTADARQALQMAVKYSNKATEKERMLIEWFSLAAENESEKAKRIALTLIQKYPQEKRGYFFLLLPYYKEGNLPKSKELCERILEIDPAEANAFNMLAYISARMGDRAGTASAVKKYIALQPDVWNAFDSAWESHVIAGMFDEALGFLNEWSRRFPDASRPYYLRGQTLLFLGEPNKAREEFRIFFDKYPRSTRNRGLAFACAFLAEGKYGQALVEFENALAGAVRDRNPNNEMRIRIDLARMRALADQFPLAFKEFAAAEALAKKGFSGDPNPYPMHIIFLRGLTFLEEGDDAAAREQALIVRSYSRNARLRPLADAYFRLLSAGRAIRKGDAGSARKELDQIEKKLVTFSPLAGSMFAQASLMKGDSQAALTNWKMFKTNNLFAFEFQDPLADPFHFWVMHSQLDFRLGQVYEQMREMGKAAEHYRKFLTLWKEADAGRPEVEEARKRLATLKL